MGARQIGSGKSGGFVPLHQPHHAENPDLETRSPISSTLTVHHPEEKARFNGREARVFVRNHDDVVQIDNAAVG